MDAFSLDHDKTGKVLSQKGNPLNKVVESSQFGFGKESQDTFSNAFTSVDSELDRLHQKFDDPSKKDVKKPNSVMPSFSLFNHVADDKKKVDTSKLDAPVAANE